jgi:hypothetical protein
MHALAPKGPGMTYRLLAEHTCIFVQRCCLLADAQLAVAACAFAVAAAAADDEPL